MQPKQKVRYSWALFVLIAFMFCGSLGLNLVLFRLARGRYVAEQLLRLDPTGLEKFGKANSELGPPRPDRPRVILFGDSRVAMWNPALSLGNAEIVNRGWSGETTAQALLRLERDVWNLSPSLVVVQLGINDLKGIGLLPDREARIVDDCGEHLEQIARRIRERNIPVVILTIFPVGPVPVSRLPLWSDRTLEGVRSVNERLERLKEPGLTVLPCDDVLAQGGRVRRAFARDEFHLRPPAYQALNRYLEPILLELMAAPTPSSR